MTPIEIGTSMLALPRFSEAQAERKNGRPANSAHGVATIAAIQYINVRVAGVSSWPNRPAQAGTVNIITLPAPKPATPSATASSLPSRSWAASASAGSNRQARYPRSSTVSSTCPGSAVLPANSTASLPVVRLSRAASTPGRARTAFSILLMQPAQRAPRTRSSSRPRPVSSRRTKASRSRCRARP